MTARRQWLRLGFLCLIAAAAPAGSLTHAQSYPSGPVKFITQIAAGSGTDPAMRVVIEQLGRMWGQQTVLVNQPGAGGALAARAAYTATADGHTLFMAVASTFTVLPQLQPNLSINVDEFVPIGFVGEVPMAIAVTPSLPVSSLPELIARSKSQPGGLHVAMPFRGGIPHMTAELFRQRSSASLTYVFYPGAPQAISDVLSGRVSVLIEGLGGPLASGQFQIACRCLNRTPGIAAEPPNGVRDGAWIFGVRMVRPRRTTRNLGVHREKDQRRPTSSTGSAGCPPEIPGLQPLDARDVAATAC